MISRILSKHRNLTDENAAKRGKTPHFAAICVIALIRSIGILLMFLSPEFP